MPRGEESRASSHTHVEQVARRLYRAHSEGGHGATRLSREFRATTLPVETRAAAAKRLGVVAIIMALVFSSFFLAFLASGRTLMEDPHLVEIYGNPAISALSPVVVGSVVLFSLAIFWLSRGRRMQPERLLRLGVAYQLFVGFSLGIVTHLSTWQGIEQLRMWSGVTIWIIILAVLVPSTPRRVLLVSSATALMDPLGLVTTIALGAPTPPPAMWVMLFVPTLTAVGLAVACSIMIHRLGEKVEAARALGAYELVELLGKGGMGEVWRAQHRSLARPAAIKLIRGEALAKGTVDVHRTLASRFDREAQATAALESEHTVTLYDYGVASDGSFYYVMELLRGMDLEEAVGHFGPLSPERVVDLLIQACRSLEEAHQRGLVHRDIKPANLFLACKGLDFDFVKVLDFGLVKQAPSQTLATDEEEARLTIEGSITGTPDYIAPESVGCEDVDARADLYGLGCVAYFALTGETLFGKGRPIRILMAHMNEEPQPIATRASQPIPDGLAALIHQCLEKDPDRRPSTARELRERLEALEVEPRWTQARAKRWWSEVTPEASALTLFGGAVSASADTLVEGGDTLAEGGDTLADDYSEDPTLRPGSS